MRKSLFTVTWMYGAHGAYPWSDTLSLTSNCSVTSFKFIDGWNKSRDVLQSELNKAAKNDSFKHCSIQITAEIQGNEPAFTRAVKIGTLTWKLPYVSIDKFQAGEKGGLRSISGHEWLIKSIDYSSTFADPSCMEAGGGLYILDYKGSTAPIDISELIPLKGVDHQVPFMPMGQDLSGFGAKLGNDSITILGVPNTKTSKHCDFVLKGKPVVTIETRPFALGSNEELFYPWEQEASESIILTDFHQGGNIQDLLTCYDITDPKNPKLLNHSLCPYPKDCTPTTSWHEMMEKCIQPMKASNSTPIIETDDKNVQHKYGNYSGYFRYMIGSEKLLRIMDVQIPVDSTNLSSGLMGLIARKFKGDDAPVTHSLARGRVQLAGIFGEGYYSGDCKAEITVSPPPRDGTDLCLKPGEPFIFTDRVPGYTNVFGAGVDVKGQTRLIGFFSTLNKTCKYDRLAGYSSPRVGLAVGLDESSYNAWDDEIARSWTEYYTIKGKVKGPNCSTTNIYYTVDTLEKCLASVTSTSGDVTVETILVSGERIKTIDIAHSLGQGSRTGIPIVVDERILFDWAPQTLEAVAADMNTNCSKVGYELLDTLDKNTAIKGDPTKELNVVTSNEETVFKLKEKTVKESGKALNLAVFPYAQKDSCGFIKPSADVNLTFTTEKLIIGESIMSKPEMKWRATLNASITNGTQECVEAVKKCDGIANDFDKLHTCLQSLGNACEGENIVDVIYTYEPYASPVIPLQVLRQGDLLQNVMPIKIHIGPKAAPDIVGKRTTKPRVYIQGIKNNAHPVPSECPTGTLVIFDPAGTQPMDIERGKILEISHDLDGKDVVPYKVDRATTDDLYVVVVPDRDSPECSLPRFGSANPSLQVKVVYPFFIN